MMTDTVVLAARPGPALCRLRHERDAGLAQGLHGQRRGRVNSRRRNSDESSGPRPKLREWPTRRHELFSLPFTFPGPGQAIFSAARRPR